MWYQLLSRLDNGLQTIGIGWVYCYERWALPLAVCLLLLWPHLRRWRWCTYALAFVLFFYILYFDMYWHSPFAFALVLGSCAYWYSRGQWARVVAVRPARPLGRLVPWEGLRNVRESTWLAVLAAAFGGALFWLPLGWGLGWGLGLGLLLWLRGHRVPAGLVGVCVLGRLLVYLLTWVSLLLLLVTLAATPLAVYGLWALRGGEVLLLCYLLCDPRMLRYLDCVRALNGPGWFLSDRSVLTLRRLVSHAGPLDGKDRRKLLPRWRWSLSGMVGYLYGRLFQGCGLPPLRQFLRFLSRHSDLPALESRFVMQTVQHARRWTWHRHDRLRYSTTVDEYQAAVAGLSPLPAELHAGEAGPRRPPRDGRNARVQRLRWLALTEALAECHVFHAPRTPPVPAELPDVLQAAGLLSQAAELQHEVADDLAAYGAGREVRELRMAIHFFRLAAQCLELFLDPDAARRAAGSDEAGAAGVDGTFCRPVFEEAWWKNVHKLAQRQQAEGAACTADRRDLIEPHVRLALCWLYLLLARLETQCEAAANPATAAGRPAPGGFRARIQQIEDFLQRYDLPHDVEGKLLQFAANASLLLSVHAGGWAQMLFAHLWGGGGDPLVRFAAQLQTMHRGGRVESRRMWMLLGRLSESEMRHGPPGGMARQRHRQSAEQFYRNAGSRRWFRLRVQEQGGAPGPGRPAGAG